MSEQTKQSLAESLETDTILLPHMPYLLQDLWALGSSIELIIKGIEKLDLPDTAKVLDLGCGKGAVSVQLASGFGFSAVGIDAMDEFLEDARNKAMEFNVEKNCQFINQDMREYTSRSHDFDIVILASIGGIFGSWEKTISVLRTQVKSGGYIFIDDGYAKNSETLDRKGYDHYQNHPATVRALASFGDVLVDEYDTSDVSLDINDEYTHLIELRGKELAQKHPGLEKKIIEYVRGQYEECEFLEKEVAGALWVVQKI